MDVEARRKRERPRTWIECVKEDLREKNLTEDEYGDRGLCKRIIKNSEPI